MAGQDAGAEVGMVVRAAVWRGLLAGGLFWGVSVPAAAKDPVLVVQDAPPPAAGATVYVEKDGAPLRETADGRGKLVKKMALGLPLTVQADAAVPGVLAGQKGHWVRVYSNADGAGYGWMWNGTLTPARFKQDLDGDGEAEVVTVGFNKDDEVVVRVREPKATDPDEASTAVNLGLRDDIEGHLTSIEVSIVPAAVAGLPLVQVMWRANEMCGSSTWFSYASYREEGKGKGVARIALAHMGEGGDAPVFWNTRAHFLPDAQAVELVETTGSEGDDAGQGATKTTTVRYTLKDGVFIDPSGAKVDWQGPMSGATDSPPAPADGPKPAAKPEGR